MVINQHTYRKIIIIHQGARSYCTGNCTTGPGTGGSWAVRRRSCSGCATHPPLTRTLALTRTKHHHTCLHRPNPTRPAKKHHGTGSAACFAACFPNIIIFVGARRAHPRYGVRTIHVPRRYLVLQDQIAVSRELEPGQKVWLQFIVSLDWMT